MSFLRFSRLLIVLLLCGISAGAPPLVPLNLEYAGCKAFLTPGRICVLGRPTGTLTLWVDAPLSTIEARVDRDWRGVSAETIQGGQRFLIDKIPAGAETLQVLAKRPSGRAAWSLTLAEDHEGGNLYDLLGEVQRKALIVDAYIRARNLAAARKTLQSMPTVSPSTEAPAESRCLLAYYLGLLAEREGNYRLAMEKVQQAVNIAQRVKLDTHQRWAEEELALLLGSVGRSREASELFESLARTARDQGPCEGYPRLRSNQAWSALLAREAGESLADPTDLLLQALKRYERCADVAVGIKANVEISLALAHLQAGRVAQAKDRLARARRLEPRPPLAHALWWLDLEARISALDGQPAKALRQFRQLEELAVGTSSFDGRLRAAFGQARSYVALKDRDAALDVLDRAEALVVEASGKISLSEGRETFIATRQTLMSLHVELLLEEGRAAQALELARQNRSRMLRQLEPGDRLAGLAPDRRSLWDRLMAQIQTERAALEERERNDWGVPTDELPRERASRQAAAEYLKKLLDQAYSLLGDDRQPAAEPPPGPGELILAYLPLPQRVEAGARHNLWAGFAADGQAVAVQRFTLPPDLQSLAEEELAHCLLDPFRASIEKARRIRILSSGPLQSVDFHKLPFAGKVLLARCPVVYGLDLLGPRAPRSSPGRHALLVANPRGDLPGTIAEALAVHEALVSGKTRWVTEELESEEATRETILRRLAAVDLLHYAGHGTYSGFGGWDSSLLLAQKTRLTLADLLTLNHVPAWVILSACDSGRSNETPVESLDLANAFLLAGSQAVVASTRRANDLAVPELFTELYRKLDEENDLAVALQLAQLAWRGRPGVDWSGFRLFVP